MRATERIGYYSYPERCAKCGQMSRGLAHVLEHTICLGCWKLWCDHEQATLAVEFPRWVEQGTEGTDGTA